MMTPQQYKKMIDDYNRKVNQHNAQTKRNIDNYNREVKKYNTEVNREIQKVNDFNKKVSQNYNNQVRAYNNAQRIQKRQLQTAVQNFNKSRFFTTETTIHRQSVQILENSYEALESYNERNNIQTSTLLYDLPTQETSNSVQLYNSLSGLDEGEHLNPQELQLTEVEDRLYSLSTELGKRWRGAIYSLNPNNPDAARHFCTSVREIFIELFEIKAPDNRVLIYNPNCILHQGKPSRKEKIKYLLLKQANISIELINFVDNDVSDLLSFFQSLNDGTHGHAGKFNVQQLLKLKKRAEDSIIFITALDS